MTPKNLPEKASGPLSGGLFYPSVPKYPQIPAHSLPSLAPQRVIELLFVSDL